MQRSDDVGVHHVGDVVEDLVHAGRREVREQVDAKPRGAGGLAARRQRFMQQLDAVDDGVQAP